MFDFFNVDTSKTNTNAIDLLKADHDNVKELFDEFEKSDNGQARKKIVKQALTELKLHAAVEEEIFYPAVRAHVGKDLMNEADEEHHVAKLLIAELEDAQGHGDHFDAKFKVLAESVRHHIKEEENEMLPKAKELKMDFDKLGEKMLARKQELLENGFPTVGEEKMVAATHSKGDSPAQAARKKKTVKHKVGASR
jgi:hemerythrin-like domain-containing protein